MKKFLALTLIGLLFLNGITVWALEGKKDIINNIDISNISSFKDVQNHWSKPYVTKLLATGIIKGYDDGTFRPNQSTTRGEFIKMLIVSLHEDPGVSKEGHWAESYENFAIEKGYLLDKFDNLNKHITREEIAILVSRATNERADNIEDMKKAFKDYPVDEEVANHIAKVAGLGIIKGDKGKFRPNDSATRAEVSTILIRVLNPFEREIPKVIEEKPVEKDVESFIEPIFKVRHYTELVEADQPVYGFNFILDIENYEEYDDSYQVKVECINVPELNIVDNGIWGADAKESTRHDLRDWKTLEGASDSWEGAIWKFNREYHTTKENTRKINIYEGMELDFKVTLKKDNIQKVYNTTVTLKEKVGDLFWKNFY